MTVWLAVAVAVPFALLAWVAIWSRRGTWGRPAAIALFLVSLPMIAAAGVQSLGQHRPLNLAWELPAGDHRVLAVKMIQDQAIYLYLDTPDRLEPWPLVLPWSNETANRLQKLQDEATQEAQGQFVLRYDPSLDVNPRQFHPLPIPQMMPPKPRQQVAPHYEQGASL